MQKTAIVVALATLATLAACKKTGDGTYAVERPTVGTTTDTIHTPTVTVGTDTHTVVTPKVQVKTDTTKIVTPKVTVKKP